MSALFETNFALPGQTGSYKGKVRDVYTIGDLLVMIASDRISAFDHILTRAIPHKGQVLNQIATHFLLHTQDIVPNWLMATPDPNVAIGHRCDPIKIEMVIRGYLAGHAWRTYRSGERNLCGVRMPDDMRESDAFPQPIITPASKADEGHDEDISASAILEKGLVTESQWNQLCGYTTALFKRGSEMARQRGLILVDTKYEFGMKDGKIVLIDEIHTPDSSRYYYLDGYEDRQKQGIRQKQLSKEFVREWLMQHDFQGLEGQLMPTMPDDFVNTVTDRYIELFEKITGQAFIKADTDHMPTRILTNIKGYLENMQSV